MSKLTQTFLHSGLRSNQTLSSQTRNYSPMSIMTKSSLLPPLCLSVSLSLLLSLIQISIIEIALIDLKLISLLLIEIFFIENSMNRV